MADNPEAITSHWRIEVWFPDLSLEIVKRLKVFREELIKFNRTLNLVSPKTIPMADAIHFSDSILGSRVIMQSNPRLSEIYDLGVGSGFPGIVFAILYPEVRVHILETDQKKSEFLRHILALTQTKNADVLNSKIDDLKDNSVAHVMCRGFASISKVILLLRRCVPKGGIVYHMKGEQWGMEVSEIPIQLCSLWAPGLVGEYRLPVGEMKFSVIKTDKIS